MKEKIHPKYEDCKVTCGCGEIFMTRATRAEINVEICSKCHPFFTGKQKLVDTAGRVEKFQRRYAKFQAQSATAAPAADSSSPAEAAELRRAGAAAPAEAPASKSESAAPAPATAAPEKPTSAAPADKPAAPQN